MCKFKENSFVRRIFPLFCDQITFLRTKLVLDIELEFVLVAISCHQMDYRFCWALNQNLGLELKKCDDYSISIQKNKTSFFSRYEYTDSFQQIKYTILANRGSASLLAKEHAKVDYFLLLEGYCEDLDQKEVLERIKKTPFVLTAFYLDPNALASKTNFLLE